MLTEEKIVSSIEILENCVLVKYKILIKRDGVDIASSIERTSFMEHQDFSKAPDDVLKYLKIAFPNRFSASGEILPPTSPTVVTSTKPLYTISGSNG